MGVVRVTGAIAFLTGVGLGGYALVSVDRMGGLALLVTWGLIAGGAALIALTVARTLRDGAALR